MAELLKEIGKVDDLSRRTCGRSGPRTRLDARHRAKSLVSCNMEQGAAGAADVKKRHSPGASAGEPFRKSQDSSGALLKTSHLSEGALPSGRLEASRLS